ncbi:heat shock 70 kDa protein 15-like [Iris pallida]|uniref:Heat shock 70 kDa protein 15-like n=1 Tax=Iris pallida TaxID=29817 RepID=A0AAX6F852_IRIPA|nr:heat shock 70 kDa protein 15-like [Iris pallida]KAJ6817901.1 heat shock 70 kDa protein 15-like [Iris pallida]
MVLSASREVYEVHIILMSQVISETFGAMAKTKMIAFILEQVRLCLDLVPGPPRLCSCTNFVKENKKKQRKVIMSLKKLELTLNHSWS